MDPTNTPAPHPPTFRAEARAGGEAGHIHDLDSKLLARVPVDAAAHHTEGAPRKGERESKFSQA